MFKKNLLSPNFNVDFTNLKKKYELCAGESLRGKVDFLLVDSPKHKQNHRNDSHAIYAVLGSKSMSDVASAPEDKMKPEARALFCFNLQFAL